MGMSLFVARSNRRPVRWHKSIAACFAVATFIGACVSEATAELAKSEFVMDTACTIRITKGGDEAALDAAFERLKQIDGELSEQNPDSEIAKVNAAAGLHPVKVSDDSIAMVKRDLSYAAMSDGAFDPTVGPLVRLWGIGTDHARLPSKAEISATLA